MKKRITRTFIDSEEVYEFLKQSGLNMVAGEEAKDMESSEYFGMDFMLRYIDKGFSRGKLEMVAIKDLPKGLKKYFKEHLLELFDES